MITSAFVKESHGLEQKQAGLGGQNPNCPVFLFSTGLMWAAAKRLGNKASFYFLKQIVSGKR